MRSRWGASHSRLAKMELTRIKKVLERKATSCTLAQFSKDPLVWIKEARPAVEGKLRTFLTVPFWEEIYKDDFHSKIIIGGRQIYKTTYITDMLAYEATTISNEQFCYVTFSQQSQTSFSRQKLRIGTFGSNPILAQFPRKGQGNVGEISLKNGSTIYCTIDTNEYKNVEGKSLAHCFLDEAQYQHLEFVPKVIQTMMATKGKLTLSGIGGESGSAYEELWKKSDQRHWIYDDKDWRKKLQFDENGLVIGDYLKDVLQGRWVAQKPENNLFHGYHIPQTIFATIPLTIQDAILDYKINPMFSVEYQKINNHASIFTTHTLGEFYKTTQRPVTPEMVLACMNPYRYIGLMTPSEIAECKNLKRHEIKIAMGVDWGSGNPSNTVIAIVIEWKTPYGQNRYHLVYLDKRPSENQLDQAEYVCNLFKAARCNIGIADLGYGANQVKIVQDGGHNRFTGDAFSGVGSLKFLGCRTVDNEAQPVGYHASTTDEHGDKTGRVEIDKTAAIQKFINMLDSHVVHPLNPNQRWPKLIIPFKDEYQVEWLVKDFTSITRKDLEKREHALVDPRQNAKKEFNHPKDSVMAIIYAIHALGMDFEWRGGSLPPSDL